MIARTGSLCAPEKGCSLSMDAPGRDCKLSLGVNLVPKFRRLHFNPTLLARLAILRLVLILVTVPVFR